MKKYSLLFVSILFLLVNEMKAQERAIIKIDTDRVIDQINPHLYGNFSEHLGEGIYGGIYDPASVQADEDGFRKDVIEQATELKFQSYGGLVEISSQVIIGKMVLENRVNVLHVLTWHGVVRKVI